MRLVARFLIPITFSLVQASTLFADRMLTSLRVNVNTFAVRRIDAKTPTRVLFMNTPMSADVYVTAGALPSVAQDAMTYTLPSARWWEQLQWEIQRADGKDAPSAPPRAQLVREHRENAHDNLPTAVLRSGERATATFNLRDMAPGVYSLRVHLGALTSEAEWFLVSNGTENEGIRREFARYRVDHSVNAAELHANLVTLAAADPLNAGRPRESNVDSRHPGYAQDNDLDPLDRDCGPAP